MVGAVEGILGLRPEIPGLRVSPSIPKAWESFEMTKMFRGKKLHIRVENPEHVEAGVKKVLLNGRVLDGDLIPVTLLKESNEIVVTMGERDVV